MRWYWYLLILHLLGVIVASVGVGYVNASVKATDSNARITDGDAVLEFLLCCSWEFTLLLPGVGAGIYGIQHGRKHQ